MPSNATSESVSRSRDHAPKTSKGLRRASRPMTPIGTDFIYFFILSLRPLGIDLDMSNYSLDDTFGTLNEGLPLPRPCTPIPPALATTLRSGKKVRVVMNTLHTPTPSHPKQRQARPSTLPQWQRRRRWQQSQHRRNEEGSSICP